MKYEYVTPMYYVHCAFLEMYVQQAMGKEGANAWWMGITIMTPFN